MVRRVHGGPGVCPRRFLPRGRLRNRPRLPSGLNRNRTMPALFTVHCIFCDRPAELPFWQTALAGHTAGGESFFVEVPLCLECEEKTRPEGEDGCRGK